MLRKTLSSIILLLFISSNVHASEADLQKQIDELKLEIRKMAAGYEKRIKELEDRINMDDESGHGAHVHDHMGRHSHGHEGHSHHHGLLGDRVSIIGGLDARYVNAEKEKNIFMVHEAKIGAQAHITDWLFGYITVTKHHGEDVHIEEAYAILGLKELNLSVKPGKFFVNFGPENRAHFFGRRTITPSAMHNGMFGDESWADTGIQVDWKVPFDFYSDVSFAVLNGDNSVSFGDGTNEVSNNNMPVTANWTNAFETEYGYLRTGNSLAWGQWDRNDKYNVYLMGGDIYYKFDNFEAQAEVIYRWKELSAVEEEDAYGYYFWGAYTFPLDYKYVRAVELLAGFGQFIPDTGDRETRVTPQLSLVFNDFAKLRATYEIRDQYPRDRKDNRFITQFALAF